jgi:hypothetical protein
MQQQSVGTVDLTIVEGFSALPPTHEALGLVHAFPTSSCSEVEDASDHLILAIF